MRIAAVFDNLVKLKLPEEEDWMRSYKLEELFDALSELVRELKALEPEGAQRMSANPHANGGLLRKELKFLDFRNLPQIPRNASMGSARGD